MSAEVRGLAPGLWSVDYTTFSSTAYLLKAGEEAWIVDPGCGPEEELLEALERAGIAPQQVSKVFLTHSHFDHTANVRLFPKATVHGSALTIERLKNNDPLTFLWTVGLKYDAGNRHEPLADGQTVKGGGLELKCIHTPGHVADAVVYHEPNLKILFSGDTLFAAPNLPRLFEEGSVGRPELLASLLKLRGIEAELLAPGHPPVSRDFNRELEAALEALKD